MLHLKEFVTVPSHLTQVYVPCNSNNRGANKDDQIAHKNKRVTKADERKSQNHHQGDGGVAKKRMAKGQNKNKRRASVRQEDW